MFSLKLSDHLRFTRGKKTKNGAISGLFPVMPTCIPKKGRQKPASGVRALRRWQAEPGTLNEVFQRHGVGPIRGGIAQIGIQAPGIVKINLVTCPGCILGLPRPPVLYSAPSQVWLAPGCGWVHSKRHGGVSKTAWGSQLEARTAGSNLKSPKR